MSEVPKKILEATLFALYHATVFSRNCVKSEGGSDAVYQVMEAIHDIPQILLRWGTFDNNEEKIRAYLGYFNPTKFGTFDGVITAPNLVELYDKKMHDLT